MGLKSNFELMAKYNQVMNESIYRSCSTLSGTDLAKDQGAFFGSIINTLNHILVGDTIWLKRFSNHKVSFSALNDAAEWKTLSALDSILYADFSELTNKRAEMDSVILSFASELTDEILTGDFSYVNTKGVKFSKGFSYVLQHFFNHQTHHRGQVSTLLYQQGIDVGVTDLLQAIPNA